MLHNACLMVVGASSKNHFHYYHYLLLSPPLPEVLLRVACLGCFSSFLLSEAWDSRGVKFHKSALLRTSSSLNWRRETGQQLLNRCGILWGTGKCEPVVGLFQAVGIKGRIINTVQTA